MGLLERLERRVRVIGRRIELVNELLVEHGPRIKAQVRAEEKARAAADHPADLPGLPDDDPIR